MASEPEPPREIDWICSICLFVPVDRERLDEDEQAWLDQLTMISGYLVCVYHQGYVSNSEYSQLWMFAKKQQEARRV